MSFFDFIATYWMIVVPISIIGLILVVILIVVLVRKGYLKNLELFGVKIQFGNTNSSIPMLLSTFSRSDSSDFVAYCESLLVRSRRIVMVGTGLNLLQREPIYLAVAERAARGECDLEIYMANPFSPDVEVRLIEEELGTVKPSVGRSGLIDRIGALLKTFDRLGRPENLKLGLFSNYPTIAMFVMDDDYFFYPYGYALLGNFSPVEHLKKSEPAHLPMIQFLEDHYHRIKNSAVDARKIIALNSGEHPTIDNLSAAAAYFVPAASDPLYKFGSKVIGYYVREQRSADSPWGRHVGRAAEYGFHLTVADALYFADRGDVDRVTKEIEFLCNTFPSFRLDDVELRAGFPDQRSISLICRDDSGLLEALHHELVFRVYRRAWASKYTVGMVATNRDASRNRTKTMIQRYHAPYILGRFQPHFSLLTDVAPERINRTLADLSELLKKMVPDRHVDFNSIAVMSHINGDLPWKISNEFRLK